MSHATVTQVALLRGINVGGKNMLPMKELVAIFTDSGCRDVATYIQSGNVIFTPPARGAAKLASAVTATIRERFGLEVPVVIRTGAELEATIEGNPFLAAGADPAMLHVLFLATNPAAARVAALDPDRSPPDAFAVRGREIYLCLPNGAARTKLTNTWFDRALETTSTGRNWRTVEKLCALARGVAS